MDKPSSIRLLAIRHDGRVDMTLTPRERTNAIILFTPLHDIYRICILHPSLATNVDNLEQQNNHHNQRSLSINGNDEHREAKQGHVLFTFVLCLCKFRHFFMVFVVHVGSVLFCFFAFVYFALNLFIPSAFL